MRWSQARRSRPDARSGKAFGKTWNRFARRARVALLALCAGLLLASPAVSGGGGTIEGTVKAMPPKFLPETVVYLESVPGEHSPQTVDMDQKAMKFVPHVLSVSVGDTVRFWNHDTVPHNVFSPEGGYNLGTWPPGEHRDHTFDKPGAFTQLCSLHPDMLGYVYVAPSSFSAVVDSSGHFALRDVPPGTYRIAVWNSHLKAPAQSVVVRSGAAVHASFALHQ